MIENHRTDQFKLWMSWHDLDEAFLLEQDLFESAPHAGRAGTIPTISFAKWFFEQLAELLTPDIRQKL